MIRILEFNNAYELQEAVNRLTPELKSWACQTHIIAPTGEGGSFKYVAIMFYGTRY